MYKAIKAAVYVAITGDATIMAKLNSVKQGRLTPDTNRISRTKGVLTFGLESSILRPGFKHDPIVAVDVWTHSFDLADDIMEDLRRLFSESAPSRHWAPLTLSTGDKALVRIENVVDASEEGSEVVHFVVRLQARMAKKFPP